MKLDQLLIDTKYGCDMIYYMKIPETSLYYAME